MTPMWKVVITEIQDAGTFEPTRVPPGAFFVSTERFSRTVDDLDLQALIKTIDRMQAPQGCRSEDRPVSAKEFCGWLVHFIPKASMGAWSKPGTGAIKIHCTTLLFPN
jgi:hypothetical protein